MPTGTIVPSALTGAWSFTATYNEGGQQLTHSSPTGPGVAPTYTLTTSVDDCGRACRMRRPYERRWTVPMGEAETMKLLPCLLMLLLGCSPAPQGDDFPDLVVANECDEKVSWRSATRDYWFGDLEPRSTVVLHPAVEGELESVIFELSSGREVVLSGTTTITLTACKP